MALFSALQKFITKNGQPVEGASVLVKLAGSATAATVYATRDGGAKSNPFLTLANGNALCYVSPGRYDMTVTFNAEQVTFNDVEVGPVSNIGTFAAGGVVTDPDQLVEDADGNKWRWDGALNYTFAPGEDPESVVGWVKWVDAPGLVSAFEQALAGPDSTVMVGGVEAGMLSDKRRVDRSRVMSIISAADALRRKKPSIKAMLENDIKNRLSAQFTTVGSYGTGFDGLVFGNYEDYGGNQQPAEIYFFVGAREVGEWTISVSIGLVSGAIARVTGSAAKSNSVVTGSSEPTLSALSRSGDVFTGGITTTISSEYAGFKINTDGVTSGDKFVIYSFTLTSPTGVIYTNNNTRFLQNAVCNLSRRAASRRTYLQYWPDRSLSRVNGALSGKVPLSLFIGPDAVLDTQNPATGFTVNAYGIEQTRPLACVTAAQLADVYYRAGLGYPAIMCLPGEYDNISPSNVYAHFQLDYPRLIQSDYRVYAPFGPAIFKKTTAGGSGAVIDTGSTLSSSLAGKTLFTYDIHADASQGRPYRVQWLNWLAYKNTASMAESGVDCFELDNNDFVFERCEAGGAGNDGFNHHGFGHGVLIDCIADSNQDDGFSPHDLCTFEVWGGEYTNNGKGNIIPAFGAQGFCVGVYSGGATGLSDRARPTNYGGYVCIATDERRDTTMFLVDCTDVGSAIGINSCGKNSNIRAIGFNGSGNSEYPAGNFAWSSEASPEVFYKPGNIEIYNSTFNNQTNFGINDPVKFAILSSTTLDGDA